NESSDEEFDWEEVHVPEAQPFHQQFELELVPRENIEITLHTQEKKDDSKKKAAAALHAQRVLRTTCHKVHTVCLLANARVRNKWLNDELLHARLISLTPMSIQNAFAMIHKSRFPDQNKRGRLFEAAVNRLVDWWSETFFTVLPTGHIRTRTFEEVQQEIESQANGSHSIDFDDDDSERIRSVNSLMKHALMQNGTRDISSQLFTALCRALDIPARLIVSLQSVPWRSDTGKHSGGSSRKGKAPMTPGESDNSLEVNELSEIDHPNTSTSVEKGKSRQQKKAAPIIKLRKTRSRAASRRSTPSVVGKISNPTCTPPVFWTEVFSRADSRWLPVDPIRGIVNKRHVFDPSGPQYVETSSKASRIQDNRMLYVVALEEDGFGRDVTARYARDYTAKVSKAQGLGAGPAGARKEWWERVVQSITRPYRLNRDELEDDELHNHQLTEGMPTTLAGFKDHPLYVLARHLKRDQIIDPPTELGKFRGEPVYPRSCVIFLKTAENWMRQGRIIRFGCQPMKMVKQRASTIGRQREMELALERAKTEGHSGDAGEVMQGLYAYSQTDLYRPDPIRDGIIPKNEFGNIDLYVPSMLPQGATHIPFKGIAKIAKRLGFDYAEAVTGFEFKKRRAYPVIEGIVVAAENENTIIEAYIEAEQDAEERARAKHFDQMCKRWVRLIQGLRIRDRLQMQYSSNPVEEQARDKHWQDTEIHEADEEEPGGFLTTADDVVEPFHLPSNMHKFALPGDNDQSGKVIQAAADPSSLILAEMPSHDWESQGGNGVMLIDDDPATLNRPIDVVPKTMRELAEYHAQLEETKRNEGSLPSSVEPGASSASVNTRKKTERSGVQQPSSYDSKSTPYSATKRAQSSRKRIRRPNESASGDEARTSPSKRARRRNSNVADTAPSPRVLRPRAPKSAAKAQEEHEIEEAYKRAVEE
ncbi:hypothetical protein V8B97DRAFT_2034594, partial [Scleroderma yunnanense]